MSLSDLSESDEEVCQELSTFEEAQEAGTKNGHLCTLILADGWNATQIALAGLTVLGRNQYGMFQMLDFTQGAKQRNISDLPKIKNLIKIVGLQYDTDYSTEAQLKTLRYGKVMILTDQNEEGSNFKGLFINFIYTNWPNLLRLPFLEQFITPVVKVISGETKFSFFSMAEFEEWKVNTPDSCTYTVNYYRGLGRNNVKEAKEYFSNMDLHRVSFKLNGPEDDPNMIKAFDKNAVEQQREWLTHHMNECKRREALGLQNLYLYMYTGKTKAVTISEFINSEYVFFANFDNVRSIPSIIDGFKPGQRKVLYTCIKRNDKKKVRVVQLTGSVAEESAYYQGEFSLCETIYNMARNYVGSNNINLLNPFGQFGTRLMGGEDRAERYQVYTMLSPITRMIFHPHDDPLLSYLSDENQKIEPMRYIPIIPMILVNGSEGTGTGWSTNIPNHDPHQIIRCLRKMIADEVPEVLTPNYKNFRGTIQAIGDASFIAIGCLATIEGEKIEITELPIGVWTLSYVKSVLAPLLYGSETTKRIITEYKEFHTDTTVRFVISFAPGEFHKLKNEVGGFHRAFKLYRIIKTNNMYSFDGTNTLRRYEKTSDILKEFYDLRLKFYVKRKEYLERKLTAEADKLRNQARFIIAKTDDTLVVENKMRQTIIADLIELGYQADPVEKWKQENGTETNDRELQEELQRLSNEEKSDAKDFDYLLNMPMWMLTEELKNELINRRDVITSELNALKVKSEFDLWLSDLQELEDHLYELEKKERINLTIPRDSKDLYPADDGEIVEFKVTDEILESIFVNQLTPGGSEAATVSLV